MRSRVVSCAELFISDGLDLPLRYYLRVDYRAHIFSLLKGYDRLSIIVPHSNKNFFKIELKRVFAGDFPLSKKVFIRLPRDSEDELDYHPHFSDLKSPHDLFFSNPQEEFFSFNVHLSSTANLVYDPKPAHLQQYMLQPVFVPDFIPFPTLETLPAEEGALSVRKPLLNEALTNNYGAAKFPVDDASSIQSSMKLISEGEAAASSCWCCGCGCFLCR